MKVELNFYATLVRYLPSASKGRSWVVEIDEGMTVEQLLDQFKIPDDSIKIIFLNGIHANGDETLRDGDRIGVFPPVAGG